MAKTQVKKSPAKPAGKRESLSGTSSAEEVLISLSGKTKTKPFAGGLRKSMPKLLPIPSWWEKVIFYFPKINPHDESSLKNVLACCFAMCDAHDNIAQKLKEKELPLDDYKISATYGSVRMAHTSTSDVSDIFGSTVNRCAKINGLAPRNGLLIGESFYNAIKEFDGYSFTTMDNLLPDQEQRFVVYVVSRK